MKSAFLVLKTLSQLKRGTPLLWPIQRACTEWVLESKNQGEAELIRSLTGINQTEIQKIMAETNFEARARVQYSLVGIIKPSLVVETGVNKVLILLQY